MIWLFVVLILLAVLLYFFSGKLRNESGLPGGRIVNSDTKMWGEQNTRPLFDGSLGLTGKPDYLVDIGNAVIPVEVKTCRTPDAPYDSHIYQLAAYLILVEKVYQKTPPYGLIHYPQRTFQIDFTDNLRNNILNLISEMHRVENSKQIDRSHDEPYRCSRCGYKDICDQRL